MTPATRPSYDAILAAAAQSHQLEMWRAAQTVRTHVAPDQGQDALLECLGLLDVTRPSG